MNSDRDLVILKQLSKIAVEQKHYCSSILLSGLHVLNDNI
jgi:hypothetical protein